MQQTLKARVDRAGAITLRAELTNLTARSCFIRTTEEIAVGEQLTITFYGGPCVRAEAVFLARDPLGIMAVFDLSSSERVEFESFLESGDVLREATDPEDSRPGHDEGQSVLEASTLVSHEDDEDDETVDQVRGQALAPAVRDALSGARVRDPVARALTDLDEPTGALSDSGDLDSSDMPASLAAIDPADAPPEEVIALGEEAIFTDINVPVLSMLRPASASAAPPLPAADLLAEEDLFDARPKPPRRAPSAVGPRKRVLSRPSSVSGAPRPPDGEALAVPLSITEANELEETSAEPGSNGASARPVRARGASVLSMPPISAATAEQLPNLDPDGTTVRYASLAQYQAQFSANLAKGGLLVHAAPLLSVGEVRMLALIVPGRERVSVSARVVLSELERTAFVIESFPLHRARLATMAEAP